MPDLSVVIPTHNRKTYLPDLLASLATQDYPASRWELLIVDDGSSDGTPEYLKSHPVPGLPSMKVVSQPQSGVATARNIGALAAQGRAVLFLDDDMIASESLVSEHAIAHLNNPQAVVIGQIRTPEGGREPWVAWEDAQMERHYAALRSGQRVPGRRDFYTGNCSVSATLFKRVGGFDTNLPRTEDVELGYRLQGAQAHFCYREKAESLHLGKHQFDKWLNAARLYGQTDVLLACERGHGELQQEIFRWYNMRNPFSKALVRLCSKLPLLGQPAILLLHLLGRLTYRAGARAISRGFYSTIYNLAYWLALIADFGPARFWSSAGMEYAPAKDIPTIERIRKSDVEQPSAGSNVLPMAHEG